MNDRELLELAAKAAGLKIDKSKLNGGGVGNAGFDMLGNAVLDWHNGVTWNPLADDGDALRLVAYLRMTVHYGADYVAVYTGSVHALVWIGSGDAAAATRYAIVRAAAKTGQGMK